MSQLFEKIAAFWPEAGQAPPSAGDAAGFEKAVAGLCQGRRPLALARLRLDGIAAVREQFPDKQTELVAELRQLVETVVRTQGMPADHVMAASEDSLLCAWPAERSADVVADIETFARVLGEELGETLPADLAVALDAALATVVVRDQADAPAIELLGGPAPVDGARADDGGLDAAEVMTRRLAGGQDLLADMSMAYMPVLDLEAGAVAHLRCQIGRAELRGESMYPRDDGGLLSETYDRFVIEAAAAAFADLERIGADHKLIVPLHYGVLVNSEPAAHVRPALEALAAEHRDSLIIEVVCLGRAFVPGRLRQAMTLVQACAGELWARAPLDGHRVEALGELGFRVVGFDAGQGDIAIADFTHRLRQLEISGCLYGLGEGRDLAALYERGIRYAAGAMVGAPMPRVFKPYSFDP